MNVLQKSLEYGKVVFIFIYLYGSRCNISIKTKLHYRCEATEGSTVMTTKEMPSLLDNHVTLTKVALEMTY